MNTMSLWLIQCSYSQYCQGTEDDYEGTLLVEAPSFREACELAKKNPPERWFNLRDFVNVTIRGK